MPVMVATVLPSSDFGGSAFAEEEKKRKEPKYLSLIHISEPTRPY